MLLTKRAQRTERCWPLLFLAVVHPPAWRCRHPGAARHSLWPHHASACRPHGARPTAPPVCSSAEQQQCPGCSMCSHAACSSMMRSVRPKHLTRCYMQQCRKRDPPVWRRQPTARRRRQCRASDCRAPCAAQDAAGQDPGRQCQGKQIRRCAPHRLFSMLLDVLTVCASSGQLMFAPSTQPLNPVELSSCLFGCTIVNITLDFWPCCLQIEEAQAALTAREAEVENLKQKMAEGLSEAQVLPASCGDPCSTAFTVQDSSYHSGIVPLGGSPAELPATVLTISKPKSLDAGHLSKCDPVYDPVYRATHRPPAWPSWRGRWPQSGHTPRSRASWCGRPPLMTLHVSSCAGLAAPPKPPAAAALFAL